MLWLSRNPPIGIMRVIPTVDDAAALLQKVRSNPYNTERLAEDGVDVGSFQRKLKKKHDFPEDADLCKLRGCTEPLGSGLGLPFHRINGVIS